MLALFALTWALISHPLTSPIAGAPGLGPWTPIGVNGNVTVHHIPAHGLKPMEGQGGGPV